MSNGSFSPKRFGLAQTVFPVATVVGAATIGGTLGVVGAVDLDSTLNVDGAVTANGNCAIGNATSDAHTAKGVITQTVAGVDAGGRKDALLIGDETMASAGDALAIHFSLNSLGTYNSWIKQQATATSPSFLNPSLVIGTQNEGTTGVGNVTDRLEVHNTGVTVTGTFTQSGVASSNVVAAVEFQHVFEIADAATADYDIVCTHKIEITDVVVIKTGAAGVAVTAQVKNGGTAITDAMDIAVADKTIVRPATIDDAQNVIAAAGTLRVSIVRTTSGGGCKVICRGIRRT
jgi:hypothetical protein